ncbi:isochorismatase family protein [Actinospica sp.]|jgi:nicotinamidase-related amidase|uniref:isochorismatase family protein n=1 Tax=Actinospica sp. TaxID=1872142 RepID=UPI002BC469DA|nr:isochorismatase family protein [Actinospica sp.]HWG27107.1 isochorismatase family protein [Actinospica sp.]
MATTLLLIDLQRNMLEPPEQVPAAHQLIVLVHGLLERARAVGASVVHVRNNGAEGESDFPGTPGWELYHVPVEGEAIVDKFGMDAFADTPLGELLPAGSTILMAGLASDYCVRATALSARRLGYDVRLIHGAHGTYDAGGRSAETIEKEIEHELREAGVRVVEPGSPIFRS